MERADGPDGLLGAAAGGAEQQMKIAVGVDPEQVLLQIGDDVGVDDVDDHDQAGADLGLVGPDQVLAQVPVDVLGVIDRALRGVLVGGRLARPEPEVFAGRLAAGGARAVGRGRVFAGRRAVGWTRSLAAVAVVRLSPLSGWMEADSS